MNRTTAILLGLVVAVAAIVPFYLGGQAESQTRYFLAQSDDSGFTRSEVIDYSRGWFSSTGKVAVYLENSTINTVLDSLGDASGDTDVAELVAFLQEPVVFDLVLRHGPLLPGGERWFGLYSGRLTLAPETRGVGELEDTLGVPWLLQGRALTRFNGTTDIVVEMPAFAYSDPDLTAKSSGGSFTGSVDALASRITGEWLLDTVSVSTGETSLVMTGLSETFDLSQAAPGVWLGNTQASLKGLSLDLVEGDVSQSMLLREARFGVSSEAVADDIVTIRADYGLTTLLISDDFVFGDLEVGVEFSNLNLQAGQALMEWGEQGGGVDAELDLSSLQEVIDQLYTLLEAGPEVHVKPLKALVNGEPVEGYLSFVVDAGALPPRDAFNFFNFIMWFDMLSLDAELEVPEVVAIEMATSTLEERIREALLMQNPADPSALPDDASIRQMAEAEAPGFVAELVTQQLITPTETGYATDVAFRSGQLTMNDKPLSLMP